MMDCNLELWAKNKPFHRKSPLSEYSITVQRKNHKNKKETKIAKADFELLISNPPKPHKKPGVASWSPVTLAVVDRGRRITGVFQLPAWLQVADSAQETQVVLDRAGCRPSSFSLARACSQPKVQ